MTLPGPRQRIPTVVSPPSLELEARPGVTVRLVRVLVTGGAGFIGSNLAEAMVAEGHEVIVLDDLSSGRRENVPRDAQFIEGPCGDDSLVTSVGRVDACVHFAGKIAPAESMDRPDLYFENNVAQTLVLLRALIDVGCPKFVFSSSCAVYGDQVEMPIDESRPVAPHSPYGQSKLMVEQALSWLANRGRIRAASLRYFNAAGATALHPEHHRPEIHLIPLALDVALGRLPRLEIFGGDYPTRDGTCIRDYIHVRDLAVAHVQAIAALDDAPFLALNLGSGTGHTNLEVVDEIRRVTGRDFDVVMSPRRPGDPAAAVASNELAREVLGWEIQHSSLHEIIHDAWVSRVSPA